MTLSLIEGSSRQDADMLPLISCIVPVYNGERYLREAIDSILVQTYRPLQIIVADDGSSDGTAAVVARYGAQVRYLRQHNLGPAAARNLGLNVACGDFVAFLDVDDLWHPEKLSRQVALLSSRPQIDLCFTYFENFWMPELAEERDRYQDRRLSAPQSAWSISTLLVPRGAFEKFGNFDDTQREFENMIWFLRAARRGAVIEVLPDVLMYRRFHRESLTRKAPLQNSPSIFPLLREWRNFQRQRFDK